MTHSESEILENSFVKGMRELAAFDRLTAAEARMEIRRELGDIKKAQFYNRQNGFVKHTPAERRGILRVFRKHGVSNPWGI